MSAIHSQAIPFVPVKSSTWFVTGINRGLGRSIAEAILDRGGRVAGTVRRRTDAAELEQRFPSQLWVAELDVSDLANIPAVFDAAVEGTRPNPRSGQQRGLQPAGHGRRARTRRDAAVIADIEPSRLDSACARGHGAHASSWRRPHHPDGAIGAGQSSFSQGLSLYCATKWGIEGFFESLSQEVAGFGIRDDVGRAWSYPY